MDEIDEMHIEHETGTISQEIPLMLAGGDDDEMHSDDDPATHYPIFRKNLVAELKDSRKGGQFDQLYDKTYIAAFETGLIRLIDEYHTHGFSILFSAGMFGLLYTQRLDSIKQAFAKLLASEPPLVKPSDGFYLMCHLKQYQQPERLKVKYTSALVNTSTYKKFVDQHTALLCWSLMVDSDSARTVRSYVTATTGSATLTLVKETLLAHRTSLKNIKEAMERFCTSESLDKHYRDVKTRRRAVMERLRVLYRTDNLLVRFVPSTYPLVFEQLLCYDKNEETQEDSDLLRDAIAHPNIQALSGTAGSSWRKHEITVGVKHMRRDDTILCAYINSKPDDFVKPSQFYLALNEQQNPDPATQLCVGYSMYGKKKREEQRCFFLLSDTGYSAIARQNQIEQALKSKIHDDSNNAKLRSDQRQDERYIQLCAEKRVPERIREVMAAHFPGISYHWLTDDMGALIERVLAMSDRDCGLISGIDHMVDWVTSMAVRARHNGDALGWDKLKDNRLTLELRSILIDEFKRHQQPNWSPIVRSLMNDQVDTMEVGRYLGRELTSVDTLSFRMGDDTLATGVVPCSIPDKYYQINVINQHNTNNSTNTYNNNQQTIVNNINFASTRRIQRYYNAIEDKLDRLDVETDPEALLRLREEIKALRESNRTRKRKVSTSSIKKKKKDSSSNKKQKRHSDENDSDSEEASSSSSHTQNNNNNNTYELRHPVTFTVVINPDLVNTQKSCNECSRVSPLSSFFIRKKPTLVDGVSVPKGVLRSICNACDCKARRAKKA